MDQRYVLIVLGEDTFGVPLRQLLRVEPPGKIMPIPNVPSWVLGVTYQQGRVLSVVDLGAFINGSTDRMLESSETRLLIADDDGLTAAIAVPAVTDVRTVLSQHIGPVPPLPAKPANRFLNGVVTDSEGTFGLLDLALVLRSPGFRVGS